MAKFSAGAFRKSLQKKVNKAVQSEETTSPIAEKMKDTMREMIKEKVYDSYSPKVYERRGDNNGLLDISNNIATISKNHIIIENIAEPNESLFGTPIRENPKGLLYDWIDQGRIGTPEGLNYPNDLSPWRGHRAGLSEAFNERIQNDIQLEQFVGDTIVKNMK